MPALSHARISCRGGPMQNWTNIEKLKTKLAGEGWRIKKALKSGDCYEVYAKTPEGDNVESFWHPVTFQKILVLKRGQTLYRAEGY